MVSHHYDLPVQSFGAKNYSSLGIILQRALLVTAAASVLIIAFWTNMGKLLILLGRHSPVNLAEVSTLSWQNWKECSRLAKIAECRTRCSH